MIFDCYKLKILELVVKKKKFVAKFKKLQKNPFKNKF